MQHTRMPATQVGGPLCERSELCLREEGSRGPQGAGQQGARHSRRQYVGVDVCVLILFWLHDTGLEPAHGGLCALHAWPLHG